MTTREHRAVLRELVEALKEAREKGIYYLTLDRRECEAFGVSLPEDADSAVLDISRVIEVFEQRLEGQES
jgi:hypothetical protein